MGPNDGGGRIVPRLVGSRLGWPDAAEQCPADRASYAEAKRRAAAASNSAGGTMRDYNALKQPVLQEIYDRIFRAHGLL
jgi:GrpB-like predicted nucleotidyltransferase (UPF0157 family)